MTGTKISPAMRCIFAMKVTDAITFEEYWANPEYASRKPIHNGTPKKQVGDNIYHRKTARAPWQQEDSVHSLADGSRSELNTNHDTRINRVLISRNYIYIGSLAKQLPKNIINELQYDKNPRDYYRFDYDKAPVFATWLKSTVDANPNRVLADPINFSLSSGRFDPDRKRMI
ncbi:hypothetical protein GCM10027276_28140 [Comamonas piscis]